MQDEEALCLCVWVTREEIIAAMPYARDIKGLRDMTQACTVCFGCESDLDDLVAEHRTLLGSALADG